MHTPMIFPALLGVSHGMLFHSSTKEKGGGGKPGIPGHEITAKCVWMYFYGTLFCLSAPSKTARAGMWVQR